ncbi:MAG: serpin family protein [Eubacterium sp.]|nr:serpin family protein [Eubacterium sp.]
MRRYELQSIRKKTKRRIFRTAALTLTMGLFLTGCGSREANSGSEQGNAESVAEGARPNAVNLAAGVKAKELQNTIMQDTHRKALSDSAVRLLQKTMELEGAPNENYLISPVSLQMALGMLATGSADGSETEKELMELLLPGENAKPEEMNQEMASLAGRMGSSKGADWNVANSVWVNQEGHVKLTENFISDVVSYYGAELYEAPFNSETVKEINGWVNRNTRERIPEIVGELNPQTSVILLNAMAFDGTWSVPVPDSHVKEQADFTNADGSVSKVNMLQCEEDAYIRLVGGQGFLKWYEGGTYAFLGLLPPEGMTTGDYLLKILGDNSSLAEAIRDRDYNAIVEAQFPEFRTEYGASMNDTLQALGVKKTFTMEAEFGKMITEDSERIAVDQVVHKAMIEVDRKGTKAAAATEIAVTEAALSEEPVRVQISLDRPFIYGIIDMTTGVPVFLGAQNTMK